MVEKNLFLYSLAVVTIFKDEARYLREWLDYHLLAGVEHFYLYNNDSSDDYKKILAPYVEENLVTLTECPGKLMQYPAYNDALEKFRFECRYMAFIDIDEFILPKSNRSIVEVVDEILFAEENAAGLGINWQCFGSNGQITADYSRGVLERFTRRAPSDWDDSGGRGNEHIKTIANPRRVDYLCNPHFAIYFGPFRAVNENGDKVHGPFNAPVMTDKIVVNHYHTKSNEEYILKHRRGKADILSNDYNDAKFNTHDRNEVLDVEILKYRTVRAKNFSFESDGDRINRVVNSLVQTLTKKFFVESFNGKLEIFLTCRALAEKFQIKIGNRFAEEFALAWIYQSLTRDNLFTYTDAQLFAEALPEILARPFPLVKKISQVFAQRTLPAMINAAKNAKAWKEFKNLRGLHRLLGSIQ